MPANASFDFSEVSRLVADITEAPAGARDNIRKATEVTARKIKDSWRDKLKGSATLPALPYAVTYDVTSENSPTAPIDGEIGFDKDRNQGPLGNISEFGTPKTAPRGFGLASLNENADDFEKGIEIAIDQALKAVGL